MTQEEKQLLLKDLCARLPYGVKVRHIDSEFPEHKETIVLDCSYDLEQTIDAEWLPYLRPMSSMTEEEYKEYYDFFYSLDDKECPDAISSEFFTDCLDWLNKHHFDYRGLIQKGLALEASNSLYDETSNQDFQLTPEQIIEKIEDGMYDENGLMFRHIMNLMLLMLTLFE